MNAKPNNRKFPNSFYNIISIFGAILAGGTFGIILLLIMLERFSPSASPYVGILTYIILPVFLIIGLIIIPVGMWLEHRRRIRGLSVRYLPKFDLNSPAHRRTGIFFLGATAVFILFTAFGTYRAFEFTESNTFCGQLCHSVMSPEYTAYQTSPHARVKCVECHVGPGAEWYVRSKLSGAYQLYAVTFNVYPRPIPTPIESLRPARETCEECHWPAKFYGRKETDRVHYRRDEENTRWHYNLLLKIGGASTEIGSSGGIHWHINNKVEYLATDEKRQEIPWVRVTYRDGTQHIFKDEEAGMDGRALDESQIRTMDCIDCHNRPSHIFQPPQLAINKYLESGRISVSLPYIKSTAVEALETAADDSTTDAALQTIEKTITAFYAEDYPDVLENEKDNIELAIQEIQNIFRRNYFSRMRTNWQSHANNIGHFISPGCYRCHDGRHVSETGKKISHDCNTCHLILEQGNGRDIAEGNLAGLIFRHPEDIDEEWKETGCYDCHAE